MDGIIQTFLHCPGLPDFPWYNMPKWEKIYQMATIYTKWIKNMPNGRKIFRMVTKFTITPLPRLSKMCQNWDFGFENIQSGNPGTVHKNSSMPVGSGVRKRRFLQFPGKKNISLEMKNAHCCSYL
jgi:hypothetical protein